jgi:hypothetical protein
MDMKQHILAAMKEELERWDELLAKMSTGQVTAALLPSSWSVKDEIAHLWAWQQRTTARMEAALLSREPLFPSWLPGVDPETESTTDQTNAWLYENYREMSWSEVYQSWRAGFLKLLEMSEKITERDLLDSGRYRWMKGYSLAAVLISSYAHHQEHLDGLLEWLHEHGENQPS